MLGAIVRFELAQQLRSPPFAVVSAISFLLGFGSVATERIRIGPDPGGLRNGWDAVVQVHGIWSLFFAFTAVAFLADAVLRDDQTRFAGVIRTTGVRVGDYVWGRFLGGFLATCLCFLTVPAGLIAGAAAPWLDPAVVGPFRAHAYAFGLFAVALPNLFLLSAAVFAVSVLTRSAVGGYLGAVALVAAYGLATGAAGALPPLLEPFGFLSLREGGFAANRALWIGVGVALLLLARARFRFEAPAPRRVAPTVAQTDGPPQVASTRPLPAPVFDRRTAFAQLRARALFEARATFASAPFRVVAALGAFNALAALWTAAGAGGDTEALIARLIDSFRLVPTALAIFYAGELVWAEREHRIEPIVAASPAPDAAFLLPKLLALWGVLLVLLLATAAVGIGVDLARGPSGADLGAWLLWYVLPRSFDWLAFATLAIALQVLSPSKLAGWGWAVLTLIVSLTLESLGLNDGLYRFGGRLDGSLADLLARDPSEGALLRLYWTGLLLAFAALAYALYGRGEVASRGRLRRAGPELRRTSGILIALGIALALGAATTVLLLR